MFDSTNEEVWMNDLGTEFHDRNEVGEIHNFCDWIATFEGKVWRLGIQKRFWNFLLVTLSVIERCWKETKTTPTSPANIGPADLQPSFSNENVENSKHPLGQFHPGLLYNLPGISHMLAPGCNNFSAKDWLERRTIQPSKSNAFFYFTPSMGEGVFIATLSPSYPNPRLAGINEMHRKRITFRDLSEAALDVLFASRLRDRNPTDLR